MAQACVVTLDRRTGRLHAANLGDSGFMIVRVFHFGRERSLVSLGFRVLGLRV